MGKLTSIAQETVEGYHVVRTFGGENYESSRFREANAHNRTRELKMVWIKSLVVSGVQIMAGFVLSFTLYIAISHASFASISAGGFASMLAAMLALLKPLKRVTNVNATLQRGFAGVQSIFELLDQPLEKDTGQKRLNRAKGFVKFSDVSFAYPHTTKKVLSRVNLNIHPGQKIALVGHSGAGKTTVINLLQRFYDQYTGDITIDGLNIKDIKLADLRRQFSLVSQQVVLFNGTIAQNIAYGAMSDAAESDIIRAAKIANAWEFIRELPKGLLTEIGDNGVLLSGGQRQRLAIARAVLKDAPILLLDEATSSLDTESERCIQQSLDLLMTNRTSLIVAHRLSTVEHADVIMVFDQGRLVEVGQHAVLLKKEQHYAKLYHMQFQ
jgi:subfamily B ATP-binding cassette protein MsbA